MKDFFRSAHQDITAGLFEFQVWNNEKQRMLTVLWNTSNMRQWAKFQIRQQFQKGIMQHYEEKAAVKNICQLYTHIFIVVQDVWKFSMGSKTAEEKG